MVSSMPVPAEAKGPELVREQPQPPTGDEFGDAGMLTWQGSGGFQVATRRRGIRSA